MARVDVLLLIIVNYLHFTQSITVIPVCQCSVCACICAGFFAVTWFWKELDGGCFMRNLIRSVDALVLKNVNVSTILKCNERWNLLCALIVHLHGYDKTYVTSATIFFCVSRTLSKFDISLTDCSLDWIFVLFYYCSTGTPLC